MTFQRMPIAFGWFGRGEKTYGADGTATYKGISVCCRDTLLRGRQRDISDGVAYSTTHFLDACTPRDTHLPACHTTTCSSSWATPPMLVRLYRSALPPSRGFTAMAVRLWRRDHASRAIPLRRMHFCSSPPGYFTTQTFQLVR